MTIRTFLLFGVAVFLFSGSPRADDLSNENAPLGCYCIGTAGNVDCDYEDLVDIADLQLLIDHLFISGAIHDAFADPASLALAPDQHEDRCSQAGQRFGGDPAQA